MRMGVRQRERDVLLHRTAWRDGGRPPRRVATVGGRANQSIVWWRRRVIAGLAVAVLAAVGLTTWLVWPSGPAVPGSDRVRQYLDVRACLLTGARGIAATPAAAAWAGLEGASQATRAMVSYQAVAGPATRAAAQPYLAGLVQRQCQVIVAVGTGPAAAAAAEAARFGRVRFVVVGEPASGRNVTPVAATHIRPAVQAAVTAAIQQSLPQ